MKHLSFKVLVVLLVLGLVLAVSCSRIEIQKPAEDEPNVTTPYTLVVKHTGCGTVQPETFSAWLDKNSETPQEITDAFSYAMDIWTAMDYALPMGTHMLSVSAEVTTGSMCYVGSSSDSSVIFVAPCTDFVTAWGENFKLEPDKVSIEYDETVVEIDQGETEIISIPEDSPFLVDGQLPVTISYGIENLTTDNLKFLVLIRHGEWAMSEDHAFCGAGVVQIQHDVSLSPSAEPLNFTIEGGDILVSPSDDTRPIFFSGKLQLRVYPL